MAEVSFPLRKQLGIMRERLYKDRGEHPGCTGCAMQLFCMAKLDPLKMKHRYCNHCRGLCLLEQKVVVICPGFVDASWGSFRKRCDTCPNCNHLDARYGTFKVIRCAPYPLEPLDAEILGMLDR